MPVPVPLPSPGRVVGFRVGELPLLLCNASGAPFVVKDECPHLRTPLSGGRVRDHLLECPVHGGLVDVRDGSPAGPPIRKPVCTYPVRARDGRIEVGLEGAG